MGKYEVITPIGTIEVTADTIKIMLNDDIYFEKDGRTIAKFNGDKIYGWKIRTGENDAD